MKKLPFLLVFLSVFLFSQKNEKYLKIGFNSTCCGPASSKDVLDYLQNFEKKQKLKPFEIIYQRGLGREGEYAIFVGVDALNPKRLNRLKKEMKDLIENQNKHKESESVGYITFEKDTTFTKKQLSELKNLEFKSSKK